jgi:hypothetical protein
VVIKILEAVLLTYTIMVAIIFLYLL